MGPVMSHVQRALVCTLHRVSWHRRVLQHRLFGVRRGAPADSDAGGAEDVWLLVGLGNPGPRYAPTRHNVGAKVQALQVARLRWSRCAASAVCKWARAQVGFMLVDELARREGIAVDKLQKEAATGRGRLYGQRVVMAKPLTYMNLSGDSVSALINYYKVPPAQLGSAMSPLVQPLMEVSLSSDSLGALVHHHIVVPPAQPWHGISLPAVAALVFASLSSDGVAALCEMLQGASHSALATYKCCPRACCCSRCLPTSPSLKRRH